jgi:hypothetical protein
LFHEQSTILKHAQPAELFHKFRKKLLRLDENLNVLQRQLKAQGVGFCSLFVVLITMTHPSIPAGCKKNTVY